MKVLFVCTGNTCRSPMLEYMFKSYLKTLGIEDIEVDSAGIMNHIKPISRNTVAVLDSHAIPHIEKMSKFCSEEELAAADCVITMTAEQAESLHNSYNCKNVISMRNVVGFDIDDPYGKGLEAYEKTYNQLKEILPKILEFIKK